MRNISLLIIIFTILFSLSLNTHTAFAKQKKNKPASEQLLTRIDFGNSYITGQTLKSGAVYLLQRKKSDMKTMLEYREKYRDEIIESHGLNEFKNKK